MKKLYSLIILLVCFFIQAQTTIVRWDFNDGDDIPEEGLGEATLIGGAVGNGTLTFFDGMYNFRPNIEQGVGSATSGAEFSTSTSGYEDIQFSIDLDATAGASNYFDVQYSIDDGTTWETVATESHQNEQNVLESFGPYTLENADNVGNLMIRVVTVFAPGTSSYEGVDDSGYSIWGTYSMDNVLITGTLVGGGDSYCIYTNTDTVNPIIFLELMNSGLSNSSSNSSTQAQEYFLDQVAHVYHEETYIVKVAANSGGDFESYFTLFVDWNKNGILDDEGEIYEFGSYSNPTGAENNQLWGSFDVPEGIPFGERRMRLISNRGEYALDPCGDYAFGQAEDYTISVDVIPDAYCTYLAENILPITRVESAGISNETDAVSDVAHEYFLNMQAQLVRGQSYELTLEGNTGGNYTDYYTLFIDWNKNNELDNEGEVYELGTITNSTGTDDNQLTFSFDITEDIPLGPTRLRIIKNRGSYATDSCGEYEFGQAEDYSVTVRNPTPDDDDYCGPLDYGYGTQPITYVNFAGIDNRSSASTSSPDHEYFLDVEANVNKGEEYEIILEGNTVGNWTNSFTVFIDWNQNNSFEDLGERYEVGAIENSTGEDGQQLIGNISVPIFAHSGSTRMRIMKKYGSNSYSEDPCNADNFGGNDAYGQAEDYTVVINSDCEAPSLTVTQTSVEACEGTTAVLEAETNGGQIFWYDSEDAETPIGSGLTFETPELTETTSFWAEASSGEFFEGGRFEPESFDAAQVSQATSPWGLAFNVTETITLNSVDVYVADEEGGEITVKLINENGEEMNSTTIDLPAGNQTNPVKYELPLNFIVPEGNNYRLVAESSPSLVRELANQHIGFPYELGDSGEITAGTINNGATNGNYYFFYNWKFNTGDSECKSDRIEVTVTVDPAPEAPAGEETQYFVQGETLADLEVTGGNLTWYADENGETELPESTELIDGTTYYVSQNNGTCESPFLAVTVYLELGVSDSETSGIRIYPNPVNNILNISSKKSVKTISIFNLAGQKVLKNAKNSNGQIDVSSLSAGTYIFKLTLEGDQVEAFKIIKK